MISDVHYYIDDLYKLAKNDSSFDENLLTKLKNNVNPNITIFEAHQLFTPFKIIQSVLRVLINYDFLINEFKTVDVPIFGTADNSKHFDSKVNTLLNNLKKSLELFLILHDKQAIKQTNKIISIFEEFLSNPKELIKKVQFFQLLERIVSYDNRSSLPILLLHNPFNDRDMKEYKDVSYYLGLLTLLDGYDTTEVQLSTSTLIKIYNIAEFKNASNTLKSLFDKLGFKQEVKINRLDNIYIKTFYRGIAVFDYASDNDNKVNKYFIDAMDKLKILAITDANSKNSSITEDMINAKFGDINKKLVNQLFEF